MNDPFNLDSPIINYIKTKRWIRSIRNIFDKNKTKKRKFRTNRRYKIDKHQHDNMNVIYM